MAREARKSRTYEGQLTTLALALALAPKPELNTYVCRRPVSRCQRLVGVNSHSVVSPYRNRLVGVNSHSDLDTYGCIYISSSIYISPAVFIYLQLYLYTVSLVLHNLDTNGAPNSCTYKNYTTPAVFIYLWFYTILTQMAPQTLIIITWPYSFPDLYQ